MASDAISRFIILCLSFFLTSAQADLLLVSEEQSLPFKYRFDQTALEAGNELKLQGSNNSGSALILVVRIDNSLSKNYQSRFNREFSIQPGPFSLTIPVTGLRASSGNPLAQPYTQMIIFTAGSSTDTVLSKAVITQPARTPQEVLALDFGILNSPVFPGFQLVLPEDKRIKGELRSRFRPSGDPLTQDGLEGIRELSIPWQNGQWQLTLWAQEQGEWEYLPHYLSRTIFAEGKAIVEEQYTVLDWISNIYLAGSKKEALIHGDLWELVGERRSGLISRTVTINDSSLDLVIKGKQQAQFLAGLVLEPADGNFASNIEQERRRRFLSTWSVKQPRFAPVESLSLSDISRQPGHDTGTYRASRGSMLNLAFEINSPEPDSSPVIAMVSPKAESGSRLPVKTRYGHWRYERPTPNASSLVIDDSYLRADLGNMTLSPKLPRRLYVQVEIPVDTSPGLYEGNIQLFSSGQLKMVDYAVQVLPSELPRLAVPVGLYLEPAPYYRWFSEMQRWTPFATACDFSLLAGMGFTTVAPSLSTPDSDTSRRNFMRQMMQVERFGFTGPTLAYAPLKRLLAAQPMPEVRASLLKLKQLLGHAKLKEPYWSIFDEPHPDRFSQIRETAGELHNKPLLMKTAGHLNNPDQKTLLAESDLAIMNHGFGVSARSLANIQKERKAWLYNMPNPRLAAGFYLWKSGADGYLQWHGRMPTADPFDPTDGREGDVIYLYPWQGSCPPAMNIHKRLLALHEATLDLRWLQWLGAEAKTSKPARELYNKLQTAVPGDWQAADRKLSDAMLMQMRQEIMELADRER